MQSTSKEKLVIPVPYFKLKYTHKNKTVVISEDIADDVISISYSDNGHGKSDSLNISIHNTNFKWMDSWKPDMGDKLELTLGYEEGDMAICGSFEICDTSFSGEPDTITITAEATKYTDPVRMDRVINFNIPETGEESRDSKTLADVVKVIAKNYDDYKIIGLNTIENIKINTIQNNKSDLEFLKELADRYGYFFKVNYNRLVFYKKSELEEKKTINISRQNVKSYSFSHKTVELYKSVKIIYQDTDKQEFKECTVTDKNVKVGKEYKEIIHELLTDKDAKMMAESKIKMQNTGDVTGNIDIKGDPKFISSGNIKLTGFFEFDKIKKYTIDSVSHSYSRGSGYTTKINFSKISKPKLTTPEILIRKLKSNEEG